MMEHIYIHPNQDWVIDAPLNDRAGSSRWPKVDPPPAPGPVPAMRR
jgi:hypothetical protein